MDMDMGKVMIIGAMGGSVVLVVKTIADSVIRYAELHRGTDVELNRQDIQERLERIETAVDSIAIEVERLGEHHRFNAQLALNRPVEALPPRVITPH
jgi:hypothetical protein